MSKLLMGEEAQQVTLEEYLALMICMVAMWVYNRQPEKDLYGQDVEGVRVGGTGEAECPPLSL